MRNILFVFLMLLAPQVFGQDNDSVNNDIRFNRTKVLNEVSDLVKEHFYHRDFDSDQWHRKSKPFRGICNIAATHDDFATSINILLDTTLKTSHTYYFSRLNPKRYQLLGVFHQLFGDRDDSFFQYDGIGIDTKKLKGLTYISAVYDGWPAKKSGLRYGDQIVAVDNQPFHPMLSFAGKTSCSVNILRVGKENNLIVPVTKLDGRSMFEHAMKSSARVIERNSKSIGYIHIWCYAGLKFHEILREHILWGKLKDCDALIVDLRDGWGGADINYLNLFRPPIAQVESTSRTGERQSYNGVWGKPVNILINGRSTSGKELFAYGFKKLKLGKVIGDTSAGAVVAGRCFLLSNDDVLYLAVRDVRVDGQRLEGVGVQPDIIIDRPLIDASVKDLQLEKAIELLAQ